jgi:hypothetical protein
MILPAKHIKLSDSLFGLGGYLLKLLSKPKTIDELWIEFNKVNDTEYFPSYHSFDNFILCIDYMFMINLLRINKAGVLYI